MSIPASFTDTFTKGNNFGDLFTSLDDSPS